MNISEFTANYAQLSDDQLLCLWADQNTLLPEAAKALDVPIYIHPNTPPRDMIEPLLARGLDGAIYGFAVECGMHLLTIIVVGTDRVLYAMDYPYQYVPEEVTAMDRMPLTDADKKAFFQTNAEQVFKLVTTGLSQR